MGQETHGVWQKSPTQVCGGKLYVRTVNCAMKRPRLTQTNEPMMLTKLRSTWVENPDPTSRMLLEEIARLHKVLQQVDQLSATVAAVWLQERGGRLAALHNLNLLLEREPAVMEQKERRGARKVSPAAAVDPDDDTMPFIPLDVPDQP